MSDDSTPIHEIRLGGIRATIHGSNLNGDDAFRIRLSRVFLDNGTWQSTDVFRRDDLPVVGQAVEQAYAWIWRQTSARRSDTRAVDSC